MSLFESFCFLFSIIITQCCKFIQISFVEQAVDEVEVTFPRYVTLLYRKAQKLRSPADDINQYVAKIRQFY